MGGHGPCAPLATPLVEIMELRLVVDGITEKYQFGTVVANDCELGINICWGHTRN